VIKMNTKKIVLFSFLLTSFLFVNSALALPCAFFGEVTLDGSPTNGTYVEAYYLNGTFISRGKEPPAGFGHYSIAVNAPGNYIVLKIKGIPVNQGSQFCENGEPNYLDISANTPTTTTTLQTTTPTTTTVSSQGNGGGGGGGRGGGITTTLSVTTTVSVIEEEGEETNIQTEENNVETTVPSETETTVPQASPITGSFLSILTSFGYWWIVIIIVILIIAILILSRYYTVELQDDKF
jgi:hypothetical protein